METHHELADLVARLGPAVLEDPQEFRAAFDDHAAQSSTSDGRVNLLTDAIGMGVLARALAQLDVGARPGPTLEAQAVRLAALRGGADAASARWALAALLFALGRVPEAEVVVPRADLPTVVPEERTVLAATSPPPPPPLPLPVPRLSPARGRSRPARSAALAAVATIAVVVAAGIVLVARSGDDPPKGEDRPSPAAPRNADAIPAGGIVSTNTSVSPEPRGTAPAAVIGGRTGGVEVTRLGAPERVDTGEQTRAAAPGSNLRTFMLGDGPCEEEPCQPWSALGLEVVVGERATPLPAGGPSYAVAVPDGASVELRLDSDGYDQRVSLVDGTATGRNIAVLTRPVRKARVDADLVLRPTADAPLGAEAVRSVHVGAARLFFFNGARGLADAGRAYLTVEVTYTTPDDGRPRSFELRELHLEGADGRTYRRRDLTPDTPIPDTAFVVPAAFTSGTLVIEGTRRVRTRTSSGGTGTVLLTLPRTTVDVRIP